MASSTAFLKGLATTSFSVVAGALGTKLSFEHMNIFEKLTSDLDPNFVALGIGALSMVVTYATLIGFLKDKNNENSIKFGEFFGFLTGIGASIAFLASTGNCDDILINASKNIPVLGEMAERASRDILTIGSCHIQNKL